jgi:hypothetical protein
MALQFYAHPFSSYCQKVLIALYENAVPFEWRVVDNAEVTAELAALWPLKRFPVLVDEGRPVPESSIIIEHLQLYHPGPVRLIPEDARAALEVRALDRFFDHYVSTPQQKIVFNQLRPEASRDPAGVLEARTQLETAYGWLEGWMASQPRGLRRRAVPVLRALDPPHRCALRPRPCLPPAVVEAAVIRARRGGGAALPCLLSARRARAGLSGMGWPRSSAGAYGWSFMRSATNTWRSRTVSGASTAS